MASSKEEVLKEFFDTCKDRDITHFDGEEVILTVAKYLPKDELEDFLEFYKSEHGL